MNDNQGSVREIDSFLEEWQGDEQPMRQWFKLFYSELLAMPGVILEFVARPGVSYSLRPRHENQIDRKLFAMIDVIDDDPLERWLSICFYEDMIRDPEGRGECIPGGLAGADGFCFDMNENDGELVRYLSLRLQEACIAAAK